MMYINKQEAKNNINIISELKELLLQKGYLKQENLDRLISLVYVFSDYLDLSSQETTSLVNAANICDLGMILIPENVFYKQGALTSEEMDLIKKHPSISYRLAKTFDNTLGVANIVQYSHESWDGSGYPKKLSGTNIPKLSRIINLLNTYVALTSKRNYTDSITHNEAINLIKTESNKQFDPELVEAFCNCFM